MASRTDHDIADIKAAADHLIACFAAFDRDSYFACFAPEASFVFYGTQRFLDTRATYEDEWSQWVDSRFRVLTCSSHDQWIEQISDDVAVFVHRVLTTVEDSDGVHDLVERETIIFRRESDGRWLGLHEHVSPMPE
jgi:ketosteroid isomerase-like protein